MHSPGTASRRQSSASTRASTLSVWHASGETSWTLPTCRALLLAPGAMELVARPAAGRVSRGVGWPLPGAKNPWRGFMRREMTSGLILLDALSPAERRDLANSLLGADAS